MIELAKSQEKELIAIESSGTERGKFRPFL
jgi:hypothetical protein